MDKLHESQSWGLGIERLASSFITLILHSRHCLTKLKNLFNFPFAEIPQGSGSSNSVRFWNNQTHSNSSWSNDRGHLWR